MHEENVLAWGNAVALTSLAGVANAYTTTTIRQHFDYQYDSHTIGRPPRLHWPHPAEALLFSQGSRNSLLNIINTDADNGKMVKVRFRGAHNSVDVFDFYVQLLPADTAVSAPRRSNLRH